MNIRIYSTCFFVFFGIFAQAQHVLTADEAVKLALEYNYGIKIANNTVEVAENNTSILNSGYLPTFTGAAGATYNLDNTEVQFSNGESALLNGAESSRYNAAVNLNYTLFDGLGRKYNYKRLKEEYQLSELEARETIETTIVQLFSIYYAVARLSENNDALEQTIIISKDRLARAGYQFDYGQSTKLEVLNAEVDINNDSINLINIKQELRNTKRDLNVVLGNQLEGSFNVNIDVRFLLELNKKELLDKTKINNVSLLQTEKNIAISQFDLKANRATQYLPRIGLTGTYGWNENNNNEAAFVAVSTNTGFSGGLNLSWDLFDGGGTITRIMLGMIIKINY
jgi:outer membrane protein TolC